MKRRAVSDRLYRKRLNALTRTLPDARRGDMEALHQTRVASRRIREALPVLGVQLKAQRVKKARRAARRVTRGIGRVRELDVAMTMLYDLAVHHPTLRPIVDVVGRELMQTRHGLAADMTALFEPDAMGSILRKLRRLSGPLSERVKSAIWREALAKRVERRARAVIDAVEQAGPLYETDRVHRVRVAVKKLRYLIELAGEMSRVPIVRLAKQLRSIQDLLGKLHDLEVLNSEIREIQSQGAPQGASAKELDVLASLILEEIHRLHGRYVARRGELLEVARSCRSDLPPRIVQPTVVNSQMLTFTR